MTNKSIHCIELVFHTLISEYQLDTMYRVGVHRLAHTMYRVGVKKYSFITQLDTLYQDGVHGPTYAYQLVTL